MAENFNSFTAAIVDTTSGGDNVKTGFDQVLAKIVETRDNTIAVRGLDKSGVSGEVAKEFDGSYFVLKYFNGSSYQDSLKVSRAESAASADVADSFNITISGTSTLPALSYNTANGTLGIDVPSTYYAFHVGGSANASSADGTLTWGTVTLNEGSSYTSANGTFTAPVDGLYSFTIGATPEGYNFKYYTIRLNGSEYVGVDSDGGGTETATAVMKLNSGDAVTSNMIDGAGNPRDLSNNIGNFFNGHLVQRL